MFYSNALQMPVLEKSPNPHILMLREMNCIHSHVQRFCLLTSQRDGSQSVGVKSRGIRGAPVSKRFAEHSGLAKGSAFFFPTICLWNSLQLEVLMALKWLSEITRHFAERSIINDSKQKLLVQKSFAVQLQLLRPSNWGRPLLQDEL